MAEMEAVTRLLHQARRRLEKELEGVQQALLALGHTKTQGPRRQLSSAARKKIAQAQRARWAEWHRAQKRMKEKKADAA